MEARRIAALELIERVKRHEIEADTQALGQLRAEAGKLDRQRGELEDKLSSAMQVSDPALLSYAGNFSRAIRREIVQTEKQRARLEPDLSKLETRVSEAFREIKTYEILRLKALAEAAEERQRKEEEELAELALTQWWRNRRPAP